MTFTHDFMKNNCGCYDLEKLMSCSFMQSKEVTLESILKSEIPTKDKFWFYCIKVATKEQNQKIAIDLAEMVLPIYESKYPENKAPREAIEAAKLYIGGHISLDGLLEKKRAAYAAAYSAAAAAAYFAYADAYAAATYAAAAYAASAFSDIENKIENYLLNLIQL